MRAKDIVIGRKYETAVGLAVATREWCPSGGRFAGRIVGFYVRPDDSNGREFVQKSCQIKREVTP